MMCWDRHSSCSGRHQASGCILTSFNSTFISLIPNSDNPSSLDEFIPISLCNCIYKIVAKVIARRVKVVLSNRILSEQFGFLEGHQIHEAIGVAQEGIHSLKSRKMKGVVLKIDLSKSYDRVSWLYICLLLTHLGFEVPFIRWVMSCITTMSFVVLINGSILHFFILKGDCIKDASLSPFLFLLVVEGLSRVIREAKRQGTFSGIHISHNLKISHFLFVDDVLIFYDGTRRDVETLERF
jgi:hypothetical protein